MFHTAADSHSVLVFGAGLRGGLRRFHKAGHAARIGQAGLGACIQTAHGRDIVILWEIIIFGAFDFVPVFVVLLLKTALARVKSVGKLTFACGKALVIAARVRGIAPPRKLRARSLCFFFG